MAPAQASTDTGLQGARFASGLYRKADAGKGLARGSSLDARPVHISFHVPFPALTENGYTPAMVRSVTDSERASVRRQLCLVANRGF